VERDDCECKFWLQPVRLDRSQGFGAVELRKIAKLIADQQVHLLEKWNEYFSD
jgi:hypothetical protein